jgi:chromosome segregation ATPase
VAKRLVTSADPDERIVTTCPSCHASLRVRRVYVGHRVRCNQCGCALLVEDQAVPQQSPSGHVPQQISEVAFDQLYDQSQSPGKEQPLREQQLQAANDQLRDEHERLKTEHDLLVADFNRVTVELEAIRVDLGDIAPGEVRVWAQERVSLLVEVERLRDEILGLRSQPAAGDPLAGESERPEAHLNAVRDEQSLLQDQLNQRDHDIVAAHGECDRLRVERDHAFDEAARLESALAERERAMSQENERLGAEAEKLRDSLELAERSHGHELAQLEAELAGLAEQYRKLEAEFQSTTKLCTMHEQRNQELVEAQSRLNARFESMFNAVRFPLPEPPGPWAEAPVDPTSTAPEGSVPDSQQTSNGADAALDAARAEVENLRRRLHELEQVKHDMSQILNGLGIRFRVS